MYGKAKSGSGETYEPPSYETKVACPKRYSSPAKRQVLIYRLFRKKERKQICSDKHEEKYKIYILCLKNYLKVFVKILIPILYSKFVKT